MNLLQNLHQSLIDYTPLTKSRNNTSTSSSISSPSSGSWSRYLGASLKTSSNAKADSSRTPKGLYLWGDVGTGKTMVMDIFYNSMDTSQKRRTHFHNFMQDVHRRIHLFRKKSDKMSSDPISPIANDLANEAWLLCLDELQVTDIADAMILRSLYTELFARGVVIVTTSNRPPDELYKNGIQRTSFIPAIELMKERLIVHSLNSGVDYRSQKLKPMKTYWTPNDEASSVQINEIWVKLCAGKQVFSKSFQFLGRSFTLDSFCDGVAKVQFDDICGKSHSAADYLEMMKHVNTLILLDVPQMTTSEKNEARRFITLLDTLYESKAKLLMTSEAEVDNLFCMDSMPANLSLRQDFDGAEEAFAFYRAVSRLREMQSEEWVGEKLSLLLERS